MYEDICYSKNFLTEVIVRVDFPSPVQELMTHLPKKLRQVSLKKFPLAEPNTIIAEELQVIPTKTPTKPISLTEWTFHSIDRDRTLAITSQALFVRFTKYSTYEDLKEDFFAPLQELFTQYPETLIKRLGLRYINNIEIPNGDPFDWQDLINSKMLTIFDLYPDIKSISRAFQILEFNFTNLYLRFQYGIHNPDYPAPIKKRIFVLDLDAYQQGLLSLDEVKHGLDDLHSKDQELFEISITNQLRDILNGRK